MKKTLYYIYDPMCAWCYAFAPTFNAIKERLNNEFEVVYIPGGLAPHSKEPMPDFMKEKIQNIWYDIEAQVGTSFNHDFWKTCIPRRSTYLSCQATLAARKQGKEIQMIEAIQEAYYTRALNPSDEAVMIQVAKELCLDMEQFAYDLTSQETVDMLKEELKKRDSLRVHSFPTLLLQYKKEVYPINIVYNDPQKMMEQIQNLSENIYF